MSKRYSGKSFKDSSAMKKPKLTFKEKRKLKEEKKRKDEKTFRDLGSECVVAVSRIEPSTLMLTMFPTIL